MQGAITWTIAEQDQYLDIEGLVQDRSISIANALGIRQSWTKPSIYSPLSLNALNMLMFCFQFSVGIWLY